MYEDESNEATVYRRLWQAVLRLAIYDAKQGKPSDRAYIMRNSEDLLEVIDMSDLPLDILRTTRRFLASGAEFESVYRRPGCKPGIGRWKKAKLVNFGCDLLES